MDLLKPVKLSELTFCTLATHAFILSAGVLGPDLIVGPVLENGKPLPQRSGPVLALLFDYFKNLIGNDENKSYRY